MQLPDIKRMRRKFGMTQHQLAKLSGVSQSLIAKIESERIDPTYTKAKRILDVLEQLNSKEKRVARDVMNTAIIQVDIDALVVEVVQLMGKNNISQVPVMKEEKAIGLVSDTSLLTGITSFSHRLPTLRVRELMEDIPPTVPEDAPVSVLVDVLKHYPILFVGNKGEVTGIVTKSDLLEKLYS